MLHRCLPFLALTLSAVPGLAAGPAQAPAAAGDPLQSLLSSGALAQTRNPVAASFVLGEGGARLSAEQRAQALDQLKQALHAQTSFMRMLFQGLGGMMSAPTMQRMQQQSRANQMPSQATAQQAQLEMKQAMIDPWVRGMEAARALEQAGDAQGAANFYVDCLQMLQADWVPAACLDGILELGPQRAGLVLNWMVDNAAAVSMTNPAALGGMPPKSPRDQAPDPGAVQLRSFALQGLGALAGGGGLEAGARAQAIDKLLAYANGKPNEPSFRGAAEGLGRCGDPRAVEPLRRLARDRRPEVARAALRGLAVGFHDVAALKELRGALNDRDPEVELAAAQALFEVGDEAASRWAVETISQRRVSDATKPDIRPQVVRALVELGSSAGGEARRTLAAALAAGPGNDWLGAWTRVALLELGDASQLPAVESALPREDWALDPRGVRSVWRAIKPLLYAVAQTLLSGGAAAPSTLQQAWRAVQLVSNFASGERARFLGQADLRQAAIAQLRWQTADALAVSHPPGAVKVLIRLLDDPLPAVRLSAARALARVDQADALEGIVEAYGRDYGEEGGVPRTPEVRASLLRGVLLRFPADSRSRKLLAEAAQDADPAVRFIALTGLRPAA